MVYQEHPKHWLGFSAKNLSSVAPMRLLQYIKIGVNEIHVNQGVGVCLNLRWSTDAQSGHPQTLGWILC